MRHASLATAGVLVVALWVAGLARADESHGASESSTPSGTKPHLGSGPASETSLPSSAPPATRHQVTGATNQDSMVKAMNKNEKAKVDTSGK